MTQVNFELCCCQIQSIEQSSDRIWVSASSLTKAECCPDCGVASACVHSYYSRQLRDLPIGGATLQIQIRVKRFRCLQSHCKRQTFAESLSELTRPFSRQTKRLSELIWHLAQALGGQAGARLSIHLKMPTSRHRILRLLRQQFLPPNNLIRALGVDDWAKKRGQSYGTILVDLDRHCVVDLLPDREAQTLATWLKTQPQIEIITRDRSTEYAKGISEAAPKAIQVADRWHLLKNLSEMLERALREKWAELKSGEANLATVCERSRPPFPRSAADADRQRLSREKRIQNYNRVQFLKAKGLSQRRIARLLNLSRVDLSSIKLSKKYQQKHGRGLTAYKTIQVKTMRQVKTASDVEGNTKISSRLHIVRGHWKEYRFCEGLFGKYKDIFWWDSQIRGDADEGEVHSSYNVQAPDEH